MDSLTKSQTARMHNTCLQNQLSSLLLSRCRLLDLPLEMWAEIEWLAMPLLLYGTTINSRWPAENPRRMMKVIDKGPISDFWILRRTYQTSLLYVSRAVHEEATRLIYGIPNFHLWDCQDSWPYLIH